MAEREHNFIIPSTDEVKRYGPVLIFAVPGSISACSSDADKQAFLDSPPSGFKQEAILCCPTDRRRDSFLACVIESGRHHQPEHTRTRKTILPRNRPSSRSQRCSSASRNSMCRSSLVVGTSHGVLVQTTRRGAQSRPRPAQKWANQYF